MQLAAVRSAIDNTGKVILQDHLRHCMVDAVAAGDTAAIDELCQAVDEALEARELIKLHMLKNCFDDCNQIAQTLAERTRSEVVQVIGKKIVLYRESKTKKRIELPK